jgi:hypothetical protein
LGRLPPLQNINKVNENFYLQNGGWRLRTVLNGIKKFINKKFNGEIINAYSQQELVRASLRPG